MSLKTILFLMFVQAVVQVALYPTYKITDYGAVGDGTTDNTEVFWKVTEMLAHSGGGTLLVPSGTFVTSPFNITSDNTQIYVSEGGEISAPKMPHDWIGYPFTSELTGYHHPALLTTNGRLNNISIAGKGTFNGMGKHWWPLATNRSVTRPYIVNFKNTTDILIEDVTFLNSPRYHVYLIECRGIEIHNINVTAPSTVPETDGVHLVSASEVYIHNIYVSNGDDEIAVTTAEDSSHSANITVDRCQLQSGHGVSIGSMIKNYIENVTFRNLVITDTAYGFRIKAASSEDTYSVSQVTYENITIHNPHEVFLFTQYYTQGEPAPDFIKIHNIQMLDIQAFNAYHTGGFNCSKEMPCTNIEMTNVDLEAKYPMYCINAEGSSSNVQPYSCLN